MEWDKTYGNPNAPITLIFEPGEMKTEGQRKLLWTALEDVGFSRKDVYVVTAYAPMPRDVAASDRESGAWIAEDRPDFLKRLARSKSKIAISFGAGATRACTGKAVKITKQRGQAWMYPGIKMPVMPVYAPSHVLRRPEIMDVFCTDLFLLRRLQKHGWDFEKLMEGQTKRDYQWCTDLSEVLKLRPRLIAVDTETTGLDWYRESVRPLTVQIAWKTGHALVIPVDRKFWPEMSAKQLAIIKAQLKTLLEDPTVKKTGHNISYDHHILAQWGINVQGWRRDTMLSAFNADDNMQDKSLDECIRRWVPAMAGYNDQYNREIDKSDMLHVPRDKFLPYAGGDADAALRLCEALDDIISDDARTEAVYEQVQLPALDAFYNHMEVHGVQIDTEELQTLSEALDEEHARLFDELINMVPRVIRRRHAAKGLKFTRADFVRDILFSKDGFNLKPLMYTPSTAQKENPAERVPSTDAKKHLVYFDHIPWVKLYQDYSKIGKMRSTYVGKEFDEDKDAATGFWKYLEEGTIHPSFNLHVTVTGRTSSRNPNGQNIPKRGHLAQAYRRVFTARPGFKLIECDLSQAELRIAAWMAHEETMLRIYREGGDIHLTTAAAVMRLTEKQFKALPPDEQKLQRFRAKAVNFGFLYGMGWRNFMSYARTDYGITYTEEEAQETRNLFFATYPGLKGWHEEMREFVMEHGYVRALHGAMRRLPSVFSSEEGMQFAAQRQAVNSPVQRFASDLGLIALARIVRDADPRVLRPILFIHDALVFEAREDMAEELASNVKFYMETPPLKAMFDLKPPVPILADVAVGSNLAEFVEEDDAKKKIKQNLLGMVELKKAKAVAPTWYNEKADKKVARVYA